MALATEQHANHLPITLTNAHVPLWQAHFGASISSRWSRIASTKSCEMFFWLFGFGLAFGFLAGFGLAVSLDLAFWLLAFWLALALALALAWLWLVLGFGHCASVRSLAFGHCASVRSASTPQTGARDWLRPSARPAGAGFGCYWLARDWLLTADGSSAFFSSSKVVLRV